MNVLLKTMVGLLALTLMTSCGNDDVLIGGITDCPGAVLMDVEGEMTPIDHSVIDMPADSDYITLTVYYDHEKLCADQISVTDPAPSMRVELLDPWTSETEPYESFRYVQNNEYRYWHRYRHHIRIYAEGETDADRSVKFDVYRWSPLYHYHSYFTVKKIKPS